MSMRRTKAILLSVCFTPLLGSCAPGGARPEGPPRATHRFEPRAVETVDGRVLGVDRIPAQDQLSYGVRLKVRDDLGRPVSVRLAPGWYLDEKGLRFAPRERVEVVGVRTRVEGEPAFLAEEIHKGDQVVRLRDKQGRPLWQPRRARADAGPPAPAPPPEPKR